MTDDTSINQTTDILLKRQLWVAKHLNLILVIILIIGSMIGYCLNPLINDALHSHASLSSNLISLNLDVPLDEDFFGRSYDIYPNSIGTSMNFGDNEVIIATKEFADSELDIGNIIIFNYSYANKNHLVMHRIVWTSEDKSQIQTKGDNNFKRDKIINRTQVKSLVIGVFYQ